MLTRRQLIAGDCAVGLNIGAGIERCKVVVTGRPMQRCFRMHQLGMFVEQAPQSFHVTGVGRVFGRRARVHRLP